MNNERVFVTGALGCIGSWVVHELVRRDIETTIFDLSTDTHRLRLIMSDQQIERIQFLQGDISDAQAVQAALDQSKATKIIHLAALQIPACRGNPQLGARVNVLGTVNVFEAAKNVGIYNLVYASSIAVYGPAKEYPPGPVAHEAPLRPRTHYGVYKQANEHLAKVYWYDHSLSSIGLRPYIVYGPGRDQGLTSSPTIAMLAAAAGQPYHIPYGGRADMQYAPDVAQVFLRALEAPFQGAEAYNIRGSVVSMADVVRAIETAVPAMAGQITFDEAGLPYSEAFDDSALRAVLGDLPITPIEEGVAQTITRFQTALAEGKVTLT